MKNSNSDINKRKLMDKLSSPPHFGPLIGLVATTYEMQPEFFETDFLPAVLSLGAWDDRSWTSRIEIEKKLAYMESATVLVDASRYRNRPRSLRVKIHPVFLGEGKAQHSKVVLLIYENAVRLIVGSANITQPGYRENREAVAILTASEKRPEQALLISSALSGIPSVLGPWWKSECKDLTERAMNLLQRWTVSPQEQREWFVWGGGEEALWEVFVSRWPPSDKIQKITIVSPFWSEDERQEALVTLVKTLKGREAFENGAELMLLTEAASDTQTTYKPALPLSFGTFDFRNLGISTSAQAVDPQVLRQEVEVEGFNRLRHLHAKVVLFEGSVTWLAYLGSANFTRRGWGFLEDPTKANVEAGIVVRREKKVRTEVASLIPLTTGPVVELSGDAAERIGSPEKEPEAIPWPRFINEILLTPSVDEPDRLDLLIIVEQHYVQGEWSLRVTEKVAEGEEIIIFDSIENTKGDSYYRVDLEEEVLNVLLREQELIVRWWGFEEGQAFPINVALEARHALPISPGRHKFSEQHLILYYQGRITWEDLFPEEGEQGPIEGGIPGFDDDYRKGVDTSRIQSYQVREFVEALKGIMDDLRMASRATEPAMRLALMGPVSPVSLALAVTDGAQSGEKSPVAAGFQLVEILACLERARTYEPAERYREVWSRYIEEATEKVDRFLDRLREKSPDDFRTSGPFGRYELSIRRHYESSGSVR